MKVATVRPLKKTGTPFSVSVPAVPGPGPGPRPPVTVDVVPAVVAFIEDPVEFPGRVGRVRAWFGRGQLGPMPGVEGGRGSGARC